jgi:hypothetical protein
MRSTSRFPLALAALALASQTLSCGDPLSLRPPVFPNRVDTVTVYAVTGTPIHQPSGYVVSIRSAVRLDFFPSFDFAYHIDDAGKRSFLPYDLITGSERTSGNPGLQPTETPFETIDVAQQLGYVVRDTVEAVAGQVYYVRSELPVGSCAFGTPFYAKMQVLAVDDSARAVRFQILNNINCGYRGLTVGLPTR